MTRQAVPHQAESHTVIEANFSPTIPGMPGNKTLTGRFASARLTRAPTAGLLACASHPIISWFSVQPCLFFFWPALPALPACLPACLRSRPPAPFPLSLRFLCSSFCLTLLLNTTTTTRAPRNRRLCTHSHASKNLCPRARRQGRRAYHQGAPLCHIGQDATQRQSDERYPVSRSGHHRPDLCSRTRPH